jgi:hypothetical protein
LKVGVSVVEWLVEDGGLPFKRAFLSLFPSRTIINQPALLSHINNTRTQPNKE